MYSLTRAAALVAVMIVPYAVYASTLFSSQSNQNKEPAGSMSGRVTLADKPASGVTILLMPGDANVPLNKPVARTTTDEDGRFQLTRVPAGNYLIQTFTPALVGPTDVRNLPGKTINLADGETVEGIDIALTRGGVITGRVVDADGQPLIQESVRILVVDDRGQKTPFNLPYTYFYLTDDRGVYRLFGIPPGRDKVHRGSSLSGTVTIEGGGEQTGTTKFGDVRIVVYVSSLSLTPPLSNEVNIGPDGSFRAKGLRPGNATLFLAGTYPLYLLPKGLLLLRVERDGVEQRGGVEIIEDQEVSGIKVILGYGRGTIRGQANVEGGVAPAGLRLGVTISRVGGKAASTMPAFPDARGRFSFEGLLPGDLRSLVVRNGADARRSVASETRETNRLCCQPN